MVVPYGDPAYPHYKKNAFDGGEDGLGTNAHSLSLGCDCLGHIHYVDGNLGPLRRECDGGQGGWGAVRYQ